MAEFVIMYTQIHQLQHCWICNYSSRVLNPKQQNKRPLLKQLCALIDYMYNSPCYIGTKLKYQLEDTVLTKANISPPWHNSWYCVYIVILTSVSISIPHVSCKYEQFVSFLCHLPITQKTTIKTHQSNTYTVAIVFYK